MKDDKELRKLFRELYFLCDNFFTNSNEKRFVIYIIDQIDKIDKYILRYYPQNQYLTNIKSEFPKIENYGLDKLNRSPKEKIVSGLFFIIMIPSFLNRLYHANPNELDNLKLKTLFYDKKREKERDIITSQISKISNLTIEALNHLK